MKRFAADLHIHTALSPCADKEMTPLAIVQAAVRKRLSMIAICDHNTTGNVNAVMVAANTLGQDLLSVIPGMEITTMEEAHVVALFSGLTAAQAVSDQVRATLPDANSALRHFGQQLLMDAQGQVIGQETKLLAVACGLSLKETIRLIKRHGGLAIAAHIDRPSFSVLSQLGMFPEDAHFDGVEISVAGVHSSWAKKAAGFGLPVIVSSDSHFLMDVGAATTLFEMQTPTFAEMELALQGIGKRRCRHA